MAEVFECENILAGLNISCEALNKVGGINERIFVGQIGWIDDSVLAFDADGGVSAFALDSGKTLKLFVSDTFKQAGRNEGVPNPNGAPMWKHAVDFVHYFYTQADIKAIEDLCRARKVFCIIEQNNGQFLVYGLGNTSLGYKNYGLKMETNAHTTGVLGTDDTTDKTTLSGEVPNKPMLYKPSQSGAATLTELEGMSESFSS